MGQRAVGILYGCEAPKLPATDSEEPIWDLIKRWEKAKGITWDTKRGRLSICLENDGGKDLLGVWVAAGGSGKDGAPYFLGPCMPLDQVSVVFFKKAIAKAAKLWTRFATYAATKEGINLPAPTLWLTPCETA